MLNEEEMQFIREHRLHGFSADLMGIYTIRGITASGISKGKTPEQGLLMDVYQRIKHHKGQYDEEYLERVPKSAINPVRAEEEAWKLLSPRISNFLGRFSGFLDSYSGLEDEVRQYQTTLCFYECMGLFEEWQLITALYNIKYDLSTTNELYSAMRERGISPEEQFPYHGEWLRERLNSMDRADEKLRELIKELSGV